MKAQRTLIKNYYTLADTRMPKRGTEGMFLKSGMLRFGVQGCRFTISGLGFRPIQPPEP